MLLLQAVLVDVEVDGGAAGRFVDGGPGEA